MLLLELSRVWNCPLTTAHFYPLQWYFLLLDRCVFTLIGFLCLLQLTETNQGTLNVYLPNVYLPNVEKRTKCIEFKCSSKQIDFHICPLYAIEHLDTGHRIRKLPKEMHVKLSGFNVVQESTNSSMKTSIFFTSSKTWTSAPSVPLIWWWHQRNHHLPCK